MDEIRRYALDCALRFPNTVEALIPIARAIEAYLREPVPGQAAPAPPSEDPAGEVGAEMTELDRHLVSLGYVGQAVAPIGVTTTISQESALELFKMWPLEEEDPK